MFACRRSFVLSTLFCCGLFVISSRDTAAQESEPKPIFVPASLEVAEIDSMIRREHPLREPLAMAIDAYDRTRREIRDYTCTLEKRERVGGRLLGPEIIQAKMRHEVVEGDQVVVPLSIYLKFESPDAVRGREILYVRGENDDKMIVRKGGRRLPFITVSLDLDSPMVMSGCRYPLTEFGILRLLERMIVLGQAEMEYDECEVDVAKSVETANGRAIQIDIRHPHRREHFQYHLARALIDEKTQLPISFESYDWPAKEGEDPLMVEQYIYRDLQVNVGLTDADFDPANPEYGFPKRKSKPVDVATAE